MGLVYDEEERHIMAYKTLQLEAFIVWREAKEALLLIRRVS